MKKSKYLFQLNHPAHFHLFKNCIDGLQESGHEVLITIKEKDILRDLLKGRSFVSISEGYSQRNLFQKVKSLHRRNRKLLKIAREFKPDLMIGTSPEIGQIQFLVGAPAIFFGEDDVNLSPIMYIGAISCYPFFTSIVAPVGVNNSIWNRKTVFYKGYQKLAYLHPKRFKPDRNKVHVPHDKKYFLLRFASLAAYHDVNASGINDHIARDLIELLSPHGEVIITSERPLPDDLEGYRFRGNLNDIHHYLNYAEMYIGDSQSMAVEASILGTPNIRYNDFVGKITVLEELENKYGLTKGIQTNRRDTLFSTVSKMLDQSDLVATSKSKRDKMLKEKIDVTAFMLWFFENYPKSIESFRNDPEIQARFMSI